MSLDRRTNAFRPDLADVALRDLVQADHYVEPLMRQCLSGVLPMLASPDIDAKQTSQVKYGEFLDIFETREDGFVWAQNRFDHYVGYVPIKDAFGDSIAMMSNRVSALRTFVYPEPNLKVPPIDELTLGSYISFVDQKNEFLELTNGGFVFASHVMATQFTEAKDYVFTAGRMLHTPYLWGGRTPKGIDCSGFLQLVLELAGIDAPRDCDQQCEAFAQPLETHWQDRAWKRGDILFSSCSEKPDHVVIMTGVDQAIHATGNTMDVTVEPLANFVMRGNTIVGVASAETLPF